MRPRRSPRHRSGRQLAAALCALLGAASVSLGAREWAQDVPHGTPPPSVAITLQGAPETVFDWSREACEDWDVPDIGARAFRDGEGQVHLLASNSRSRAMSGPSFDALERDCDVIFTGSKSGRPERFDGYPWLSGLYTADGVTVHALVHNEFHGHHHPELCQGRYMDCWRNSITYAVSHDGGRSFIQPAPPNHLVATLPYRYRGDLGRHVGYFNPTNILRHGGHFYAMFSAARFGAQAHGVCVMRSDDLADPSSWRAWDGHGFGVRFVDPYREQVKDPARHVCTPVGRGRLMTPLGGLVRHEPSGAFVLVMAGSRRLDNRKVSGIFAAASRDLITWSRPSLVWEVPVRSSEECPRVKFDYPSLLDPDSTTPGFETVGARAFLYLTRANLEDCRTGTDRDLIRLPVAIEIRG